MTSDRVWELYIRLRELGIAVWIDGGWGVDALLGRQTREHDDLDIAVHRKDNARLRQLLEGDGYEEEPRDDSSEFMYAMRNGAGQIVDVHAFEYDEEGNNIYGIEYPFGSLTGTGIIEGHEVNCIAPEFMLKFKTGYEPREKDLHDLRVLREKFGEGVMDNIIIKRITDPAFAGDLAWVICESWKSAYKDILTPDEMARCTNFEKRRKIFEENIPVKPERYYVAYDGVKPCGQLCIAASRDDDLPGYGEIIAIYTLEEYWGSGLGAQLMGLALSELREMGFSRAEIWLFEENGRAMRFYEKYGFSPDGAVQDLGFEHAKAIRCVGDI